MKLEPQVMIIPVGGADVPSRLRELLLLKKFQSRVVESVTEASQLLKPNGESVVMLHYGTNESAARDALKEILTLPIFHVHPLLLVGKQALTQILSVKKAFVASTALNAPASIDEIIVQIRRLWDECEERLNREREEAANRLDSATRSTNEAQVFGGFKSIPEEYFAYLQKLGLLQRAIGGDTYARTARTTQFQQLLEHEDPEIMSLCSKGLKGADAWVSGHAMRVAYSANSILGGAAVERSLSVRAMRAAMLHVIAFKGKRRIARIDYLNATDPEHRRKVGSFLRESATKVSFDMRMPQESLIIALFARLVAGEEVSRDKEDFKLASALFTADILDRVCWTQGFFNPQRAYIVLRKFKEGGFSFLDPAVSAATVKFASEAIVACPAQFALPGKLLRAYRERVKDGTFKAVPAAPGEIEVPVEQLSPGMQLSRALKTYDGRELLEPNLKLDEDLIWRIWQLAAVRPLEAAMVRAREDLAQEETAPEAACDDAPSVS